MASLVRLFIDMIRLRSRPQDLPASGNVLLLSVVALVAISMVAVQPLYPLARGAARVAVDVVLQLAVIHVALSATGRAQRFRQTFSAICGTAAIFALLAWPLHAVLADRPESNGLTAVAFVLLLGLIGWTVAVVGHILRHAFDIRMPAAVALAIAYVIGLSLAGNQLVPMPELD